MLDKQNVETVKGKVKCDEKKSTFMVHCLLL
jgi:hypothetical protein